MKEIEKERPKPIPMAAIVTDGDYHFAPDGPGDEPAPGKGKHREKVEGTFLHTGPGRYEPPPSYFLIRGDIESKGSLMKPGFVDRGHHRQSADRDSACRRPHFRPPPCARRVARIERQSADGAGRRQSDLEPPLRTRHRCDAGQFRQDGRAAHASRAARLAGRRVHEQGLERKANAPPDHDLGSLPDVVAVQRRARQRERPRE